MVSKLKFTLVAAALFSTIRADDSVDKTAFEHGLNAGNEYIAGMVKLSKKEVLEGKKIVESSMQNFHSYFGEKYNRSFFQGVVKALEKIDLSSLFKSEALSKDAQVYVTVCYVQFLDFMKKEADKKSPADELNELLAKVAQRLYKKSTPELIEQVNQSFAAMNQQINEAMIAACDEAGPLNQYA